MAYSEILLEVADGVALVTLNRPERLNAYTPTMGRELSDARSRPGTCANRSSPRSTAPRSG